MTATYTTALSVALFVLLAASCVSAAGDKERPDTTLRFTKGGWDPTQWKPLRMANQTEPRVFTQQEDSVGTTKATFTRADYNAETDNAVLVYDMGEPEAEVEVTVKMGEGFGGTSCPGLCISPRIKDGMLVSSIAVFIADYTMAVWYQDTAPDGKTVLYRHLVQLARWSDPAQPHVLRCRVSKKEASVALQVDNSDVVAIQFVGNKTYSLVDLELNSLIGLWGCHGECAFREMKITRPGTLPFLVRQAPGK